MEKILILTIVQTFLFISAIILILNNHHFWAGVFVILAITVQLPDNRSGTVKPHQKQHE